MVVLQRKQRCHSCVAKGSPFHETRGTETCYNPHGNRDICGGRFPSSFCQLQVCITVRLWVAKHLPATELVMHLVPGMQTNSSFEQRSATHRRIGSGTSSCASTRTTRASCCCCRAGKAPHTQLPIFGLGGGACTFSGTAVSLMHASDGACSWSCGYLLALCGNIFVLCAAVVWRLPLG